MRSSIRSIHAREILDSRGNPTLEVDIALDSGALGRAAVPSGASTGAHEAFELRDFDLRRYAGRGVQRALQFVNRDIAPALYGKDAFDQEAIDGALLQLDGTPRKEKLGANAMLGVSLAAARAAANAAGVPLFHALRDHFAARTTRYRLPVPVFNVLNGGMHANGQGTDLQEFMVAPVGAASFAEALRCGAETYQALKTVLKERGHSTAVGDEGGFAPALKRNVDAIELILLAIERAGYRPSDDVVLALDCASSSLFAGGHYHLRSERRKAGAAEMIALYTAWTDKYPIAAIEDGLAEDDWEGWALLNSQLGAHVQLIGDDLFVTNVERIRQGIECNAANGVLIKPNQVGTLTETVLAVRLAFAAQWAAMVSHRSGDTVDSFIADLSVALDTGLLKTGAPCRGERVEKYNQLLRIEEALGERAEFAGRTAFTRVARTA